MQRSALLALAVLLTACGSGDRSVLTAADDEPVLNTGSGTVLQAPGSDLSCASVGSGKACRRSASAFRRSAGTGRRSSSTSRR